jgi:hypothetical protein
MVELPSESTHTCPDESSPQYTRLIVSAPSGRANMRKPRPLAPGSGFAQAAETSVALRPKARRQLRTAALVR